MSVRLLRSPCQRLILSSHPHPASHRVRPPESRASTSSASPYPNVLQAGTAIASTIRRQNLTASCQAKTSSSLVFRNQSTHIRKDRAGGGGGLLTLVHHDIQFSKTDSPFNENVTEVIVIQLSIADSVLKIANVYITAGFVMSSGIPRIAFSSSRRRHDRSGGCKRP